jgi:hypothetical protein
MGGLGLSVMSGLASNPCKQGNRLILWASEHQDIFFLIFFQFFLSCIFSKNLKKYEDFGSSSLL